MAKSTTKRKPKKKQCGMAGKSIDDDYEDPDEAARQAEETKILKTKLKRLEWYHREGHNPGEIADWLQLPIDFVLEQINLLEQ